MDIRTGSVLFPALSAPDPGIFPRTVFQAAVGLAGCSAGFSGSDRNFGLFSVVADHVVAANTVTVTVSLGARDWSGDWDANDDKQVFFTVIGE